MAEQVAELSWFLIVDPDGDASANNRRIWGSDWHMCQHRVEIGAGSSIISLRFLPRLEPFVTYIIAGPCIDVKDKSCIEECPVDCIYEGGRMLYIQPDECVDCGACEPVCPVEAIYYEDDVPGEYSEFKSVNEEFFHELGSPGGASKVGAQESDHPVVVARPKG